jgi:hypothetical protein
LGWMLHFLIKWVIFSNVLARLSLRLPNKFSSIARCEALVGRARVPLFCELFFALVELCVKLAEGDRFMLLPAVVH